jgi:hypothetical protein
VLLFQPEDSRKISVPVLPTARPKAATKQQNRRSAF